MNTDNQNETVVSKQKKFPVWVIAAVAVVLIAVVVLIVVFAGPGNSKKKAAQQLETARRYVLELNYDQAIIAYLDTIKIDPKNTDAYLELAELYVKTGQPQKALDILEEAKKKVEKSDLDRVDKGISELEQKINASVDPNGTQQVADNKDAADKGGTDKNDNTNTNGDSNTPDTNGDGNTPDTSEGTEPVVNGNTENGNNVDNPEPQGNTEEPVAIEEDNGPAPDILPEIESNPYSVKEYNAAGQLVKTEYTDPYTGDYTYYAREYDSNGKCIRGTMHMVYNSLVNGASVQVDFKYYVDDYDSNERIIKKSYLSTDESINDYITYEYDARGNCIKETWYNSDGSVSDYRVYEYDSDGKCIKYTFYWNDKPTNSYEYDKQGRPVKQYFFDNDGNVSSYYIFEGYDDQGRPIKTTLYDDKGRVISVEEIVGDVAIIKRYDDNGNLTYEEEIPAYGGGYDDYNGNYGGGYDDYNGYYGGGYDDYNGNYGGGDYYIGGGDDGSYAMQEPICEYDSEGRVTKITFIKADGSIDYYQVFEYDANGYVIGNSTYNPDGSPR